MKDLFEKMNKKVMVIAGACAIAVLIAVICIFAFGSNEGRLKRKMESLGKTFYENAYYPQYADQDDFLSDYKDKGIKVALSTLARYIVTFDEKDKTMDDILNQFKNSKTKKKCDTSETKVIFYPKEPYGKKDYKMVIELSCGF